MNAPLHSQSGVCRRWHSAAISLSIVLLVAPPLLAQTESKQPPETQTPPAQTRLPDDQPKLSSSPAGVAHSGEPDPAEMMKQMMAMGKLNENHKLLESLNGNWSFTTKFSPAPGAPEQISTGTAVRKSLMGGRFFEMDVTGKIKMPGDDGKFKDTEFKGLSIEAYDNARQKFVGAWMDNMGTGIMLSEGTYDTASKTFTYTGEYQMAPTLKQNIRELIKLPDNDHMLFEWYEDHGGHEVKTMEIAYTRKK